MQDGALDRTYVPQSETSIEFLEKVPVTRTTLAESLLEQLHFLNLPEASHAHRRVPGRLAGRARLGGDAHGGDRRLARRAARGGRKGAARRAGARARRRRRARPARVPAHPARRARRPRHAAVAADPRPLRPPGQPPLPRDRAPAQGQPLEEVQAAADEIATLQPAAGHDRVRRGPQVRRARPAGRARGRGVRGHAQRPQRAAPAHLVGLRERDRAKSASPAPPPRRSRPASTSRASWPRPSG